MEKSEVKIGDLVRFKNLNPGWGEFGLVTDVLVMDSNTGVITLVTPVMGNCSIPWHQRELWIEEVISESR